MKQQIVSLKNGEIIFLGAFIIFLLIFTFAINFTPHFQNTFSHLAWSFLHGKTYYITEISQDLSHEITDIIYFNGHKYWHMPPLPALILMPFILLTNNIVSQDIFNFSLNILLFLIIISLAQKYFGFSKINSIWLAILYLFSSVYINSTLFPLAWYYAQTISTLLVFLTFYEYFGKKRYWLIGILLGLVVLTRFTAFLAIIFYCFAIFFEKTNLKLKIKNFSSLIIPITFCLFILLGYNYLRFNNPFITGYKLTSFNQYYYFDGQGSHFSLKYIPTNIYYYFLEGLLPFYAEVPEGETTYRLQSPYIFPHPRGSICFFIVSPLFLLIFFINKKNYIIKYLSINSAIILFILLIYYYNGAAAVGPRYLNDLLPLIFIILLYYFQQNELNYKHKIIITCSSLLNIYTALILFQISPIHLYT